MSIMHLRTDKHPADSTEQCRKLKIKEMNSNKKYKSEKHSLSL